MGSEAILRAIDLDVEHLVAHPGVSDVAQDACVELSRAVSVCSGAWWTSAAARKR